MISARQIPTHLNKVEIKMDSMIEINDRYNLIADQIRTLEMVNYQIAELNQIKEKLELKIKDLFEHNDEGSKTYINTKWKVTITTGYNYSLNKEEYEAIKNHIPSCFNPVKERIAYDLDKKIIRDAEKYASPTEVNMLSQFLEKKPKKLHVKITQAV